MWVHCAWASVSELREKTAIHMVLQGSFLSTEYKGSLHNLLRYKVEKLNPALGSTIIKFFSQYLFVSIISLTSTKLSPPVFSHLEVWTPGQNTIYQFHCSVEGPISFTYKNSFICIHWTYTRLIHKCHMQIFYTN